MSNMDSKFHHEDGPRLDIYKIFEGNAVHVEEIDPTYYHKHLSGQSPAISIVLCADSRQWISDIANWKPNLGEVFAVRTAGNIIDGATTELTTLRYSGKHLSVDDFLILGHTGCGMLKAAFGSGDDDWMIDSGVSLLDNVVEIAKYVIKEQEDLDYIDKGIIRDDITYLTMASEINVDYQCAFYRKALESVGAKANVAGAMHDLHNVYGGGNGRLYLTEGSEYLDRSSKIFEEDSSNIKKLVDYKGKTIESIMKELDLSWNEKNPHFVRYLNEH